MSNYTYITRIRAEDINKTDMKYLDKATNLGYYGYKPENILASVIETTKQLWRVDKGKVKGVIITQVDQHPGCKVVHVWSLAGVGFKRNIAKLYKDIELFAKEQGAKYVSGLVVNAKIDYTEMNTKLLGTEYVMEVDNGN